MGYTEGQTATNKQTGQKVVYRGGMWRAAEDDIGLAEPEENEDTWLGKTASAAAPALGAILPHPQELAVQSDLEKTPTLDPTFSEGVQTGIEDTLSARNMQPSPYKGLAQSVAPQDEEAVKAALTDEEAETFIAHLRPLVERNQGTIRSALAYL